MEKPRLIENPNLEKLRELANRNLDTIVAGKEEHEEEHFIYEEVMEAFYGPQVWTFINKHID
jgi:hypothetical protein